MASTNHDIITVSYIGCSKDGRHAAEFRVSNEIPLGQLLIKLERSDMLFLSKHPDDDFEVVKLDKNNDRVELKLFDIDDFDMSLLNLGFKNGNQLIVMQTIWMTRSYDGDTMIIPLRRIPDFNAMVASIVPDCPLSLKQKFVSKLNEAKGIMVLPTSPSSDDDASPAATSSAVATSSAGATSTAGFVPFAGTSFKLRLLRTPKDLSKEVGLQEVARVHRDGEGDGLLEVVFLHHDESLRRAQGRRQ